MISNKKKYFCVAVALGQMHCSACVNMPLVIPYESSVAKKVSVVAGQISWSPEVSVVGSVAGIIEDDHVLVGKADRLGSVVESICHPSRACTADSPHGFVLGVPAESGGVISLVGSDNLVLQAPDPSWGEFKGYGHSISTMPGALGEGARLIVGAPGWNLIMGRVFVVDLRTLQTVGDLSSPDGLPGFGVAVTGTEDIDGDGIGDVGVVQATKSDWEGAPSSIVTIHLFSGGSGSHLLSSEALSGGGYWERHSLDWIASRGLAAPGLIILAEPQPSPGLVLAFSPRSGKVEWEMRGTSDGEALGWSVLVIDDINSDGVQDVIIGSLQRGQDSGPFLSREQLGSGRLNVVSGADGRLLYSIIGPTGDEQFGGSLCLLDDWDGDGSTEFAAATGGPFTSLSVTAFNLSNGRPESALLFPPDGDLFRAGAQLAYGCDWDGDGVGEICVSSFVPEAGMGNARAVAVVSLRSGRVLASIAASVRRGMIIRRE